MVHVTNDPSNETITEHGLLRDKVQILEEKLCFLVNKLEHLEEQIKSQHLQIEVQDKDLNESKIKQEIENSANAIPTTLNMLATRVVMHQIILPSDVDGMGICYGGQVLSWIDICAGLAAKAVARGPCVTASVDSVHFLRPCHLSHICIIASMVNRTFGTSMEVGVRVEEEDSRTGVRYHCCSAYLTFVSIWAKQKNSISHQSLPKLTYDSEQLHYIYDEAGRRRQERLFRREQSKIDLPTKIPKLKPITYRQKDKTLAPAVGVQLVDPGNSKESISPLATLAHMTQLIMPQHANSLSITFGGQVMKWMELCSHISAARVSRGSHLLTGSMDSLEFLQPTSVGDALYISAQVTGIFGSSMEVMISVYGESSIIGEVKHCADAYATIVSVDNQSQPVEIPFKLNPCTTEEFLRCAGAAARRDARLKMRKAVAVKQVTRPFLDGTFSSEASNMAEF